MERLYVIHIDNQPRIIQYLKATIPDLRFPKSVLTV